MPALVIGDTSKLNSVVPEIILQPAFIVRSIGGPTGSPGPGGVEVAEAVAVEEAASEAVTVAVRVVVVVDVVVTVGSSKGSPGIGGRVSADIDSFENILMPANRDTIPKTISPNTINKTLEEFFFPETVPSSFSLFTLSPPNIMLEMH